MSFELKDPEKLELVDGSSKYIPCELIVLEGDEIERKVHSFQLLQKAKIRQDGFELRKINRDTITIKELSIYKSSYEKIGMMNDKFISFRFVIPAFQRGYRWETEQVHELLDDIYFNYKKYYNLELQKSFDCYCIQPLVLKQSNNLINEFKVIDGQQRLTTINLLLEALNNQVPDEKTFHAYIPISYESRKESEEFLYGIGEYCKIAVNNVIANYESDIQIKERVEKTINYIEQLPTDLNSRYMLNTYLYSYWYFYEIISGKGNGKDYFAFAEKNWNKDEQWEPKRYAVLAEMLLEATSIIWYNINNNEQDEHKVFEDFNSGKISLTGSELIKGIFMNPDNYVENYNSDNSLYKQLGIRQTMIGGQWDDMEKTLHHDEFWSFVPHQGDKEGEIDKSTHIDAIFNMYVYFNILKENEAFNMEDPLFSFKKINELIVERLASGLAFGKDKYISMCDIWLEIKTIYTIFYEWFTGDNLLKNINSLYHRISLFKRIITDRQMSYKERYRTELRHMRPLFKKLIVCNKFDREKKLNLEIKKVLLSKKQPPSDDIENFIKTINYSENPDMVEVILLAFNLSTLEKATAYGGRFPFYAFDKQKWHKDHIFATKTKLSGENNEEKELLEALISENEQKSYEGYLNMINTPVKEYYKQTINDINTLLNESISYIEKDNLRAKLLNNDGDILEYVLRDNHMGNMALLTETNNISASNDSFKNKSKKIKEWFKKGNFIPICTMNVFSDFYSSDESYSEHWLYEKRLSYLKQMIGSVNDYLSCSSEEYENG